eukprot:TRINITY_DN33520_c0_g1_i1.p1 TRINITY_DN33520_c0_g1~~TRINITY_DN33520_c0_g1_i1.p1  ORF type:complete len:408 (+),score=65.72 TRINITY_DN33520_c0_g1_i1:31-1254(+)
MLSDARSWSTPKLIFVVVALVGATAAFWTLGNVLGAGYAREYSEFNALPVRTATATPVVGIKHLATEERPTATTENSSIITAQPSPKIDDEPEPPFVEGLVPLKLEPPMHHKGCPTREVFDIPENGEKMCPIPGLNNLLYTQVNRYYCAFRDRKKLKLRDRVCMKYSKEWFRYSEILVINQSKSNAMTTCFAQEAPNPEGYLRNCEWRHHAKFYGSPQYWEARSHISFNGGYYTFADQWTSAVIGKNKKYLSLHVRRGDYESHCIKLKKKREPAWLSYSWKKQNDVYGQPYDSSCFPSTEEIISGIQKVIDASDVALDAVFLSTNDRYLVSNITQSGVIKIPVVKMKFSSQQKQQLSLRDVDLAIIDMILLSQGSAWILNKFSSFSATAYEMAMVTGRIDGKNNWWW